MKLIKAAGPWGIVAALAALCAAVWLLWWLVLGRADQAVSVAAKAKTGQVVATVRGQAAQDAARIVERHYEHSTTIKEIRDAGIANVRAAADDAAGGRAARATLCMLDPSSYGSDPAC